MKKRILLFTLISGMAAVVLTSGDNGAGAQKGYNCTGSETGLGNITGCSASGCHGATATAGITVSIELDSAGIPVTNYKAGLSYIVKITGTNTTANTLPKFGFQVSCINGYSSVATPVNAGTFATTGLPAGVRYTVARPGFYVCNMIEHNTPLTATTGTGAAGTTYVESFAWTAPAAGTGIISFWGVVNAVNGNGQETGDFWNTANVTIDEWTSTTSVNRLADNISIKAFPNPLSNDLNIQLDNAQAGNYALQVFDITGRIVSNESIAVNTPSFTAQINSSNWAIGMYTVVLQKDGFRKMVSVVKK